MHLTNPTVRKHLLEKFADGTDSSAVHLSAAALPKQAYHVILPVSSMKPTEVYAPNYKNGEKVVLIRSPHGGTFEIPELTVNNRNPEAKKLLGTATKDAIGIHHTVAERLSGADFDGDTVIVIPNNHQKVTHTPPLEGLKGFDPRGSHPPYDGMTTIDGGTYNAKTREVDYHGKSPSGRMQREMGDISNLITDMTIKGASNEEKARAIRHSMVVIDAEKHHLDFKGSYEANGIAQLKTKYQGSARAGAATLISRARSETRVPNRKLRPASQGGPIDPVTGKKVYVETGESYTRGGKTIVKTTKSTKLAETDDAFTLVSRNPTTPMETIYAEHANKLKGLANQARKETLTIKPLKQSPSAKAPYANEVASLNSKLNIALKNAPLERQAQAIANTVVSQKRQANPNMDAATEKKIKYQALAEARVRVGAQKSRIVPTQSEWDAIQAGAVSNHKLEQILDHGDLEAIKQLAMPKTPKLMTASKKARAQAMLESGYTQADVAQQLGVSVSTLKSGLSE
jgi:DNA-binding CsgD family transcriptional regulator